MKKLGALLILVSFFAQGQIKHVEPPFWWADMNHNQLELMVYGDNISQYTPSIENGKITLTDVKRTENPNYLFLDLDLATASLDAQ